jgi:outer membrane protein assembly factor BamD (BamD/ComL family)
LNLHKDREAAQQALEKIIELLPDSEMSLQASQRIAHLANNEMLMASQQRQRVIVKKGAEDIGLLKTQEHLKLAEADPGKLAEALVEHLEKHPLDGAERERLAVIYANHYQRLDLAAEQLEQLIQQPNQPVKNVVHWLNLLADLQVQNGSNLEDIQTTLKRIIEQYPDAAAAENAQRRLDRLKLELKAKEKSQAVKLGSYEQDIGLKRGRV